MRWLPVTINFYFLTGNTILMQKEIKDYYETNFGSFASLTAPEIKELCEYESWLVDLPVKISFKEKGCISALIAKKYLHAVIKKALVLLEN